MRPARRAERRWLFGLAACAVAIALSGCRGVDDTAPPAAVFTTAHDTFGGAVRDFFNVRTTAAQPFPFPHATHVAKKIGCTEYCHESVTKGPVAGLPSVKTCMICHESIATDRPLIQQLADF